MNRKARRSVRSQERGHRKTADPLTSQRFNDAWRLHQTGQVGAAAEIYRQILDLDPNHAESLQNLGAIATGAGRYEMAADLFGRALALNDASARHHGNMAIVLTALGRLTQAIAHARRAVALDLNDATAHISLGKLCLLLGHLAEADVSLTRALTLAPNLADAHFYLGNLRAQEGQAQQAIDCYLRAIEIKPDALELHNNLCIALMAQSKYAEAIAHYEQILAYKPDFVAGYGHLATAHRRAGDSERALEIVRYALRLGETEHVKLMFTLCMQDLPVVTYDNEMRDLLVRAMSEAWDRPVQLMGHCVNLIKADAEIAPCVERAAVAWPMRLTADQLFGSSDIGALARHRVLRCMLENAPIGDVAMERFLTNARYGLLQAATAASPDDMPGEDALAFHAALARQCFINEYVYAQTHQEQAEIAALRATLTSALRAHTPFPLLWLVVYAAYASLLTLDQSEALLGRSWPAAADALVTQQIREPLEELRLRDTIPPLTPIEDRVSMLVRDQYEENPYPRWVKSPVRTRQQHLDLFLRQNFPSAGFRSLGKGAEVDMLIAGCGTGQQLLGLAQTITDTRALAIDLSLPSLCFGKRQIGALGIRNIEFGQADILRLGALGRSFDIIECGGVLHHLGDPEAGWRELVAVLRPNGFMRVALYSELARRQIVAAQTLVSERGAGRTADDIRRFRQEFIADPHTNMVREITSMNDFFGISTCRDLLFHEQEHRFTLPRIKSFLAANDLQVVGLELPQPVRRLYTERFPEDAAMTDLDRWHAFEQDHPDTFIDMYHLWVQKGAA